MLFRFTYNIILQLSYPLLIFLGVFSEKLSLFTSGRKEIFERLKSKKVNEGDWVWFHTASLGEFEQARPLIENYKKSFPKHQLLLTFFSPSGYEVQKHFELADCICYLAWDTQKNANRFLDFCNIKHALFVKYEFWPNHLRGLSKRKIPVYYVSSIFRPQQLFFKKYGRDYRKLLYDVNHFFVQNEESISLLNSIGIDQVTLSGDTRMDRVYDLAQNQESLHIMEKFINHEPCFVLGSTWPEDYTLMDSFFKESMPLKLIIAPHQVSHQAIENLEQRIELPYAKWSSFDEKKDAKKSIMIVDNIGLLTKIYRYATFAYVGGGMKKKGLHNVLEPATYGIPVIIGKNYNTFQEAVLLHKRGGISSVKSAIEFRKTVKLWMNDRELVRKMGEDNAQFIEEGRGASQKIIDTIKGLPVE